MARECECGFPLDENGDCAACDVEHEEAHRLYGGGRHHHLKPPGPWRSREDCIREAMEEE